MCVQLVCMHKITVNGNVIVVGLSELPLCPSKPTSSTKERREPAAEWPNHRKSSATSFIFRVLCNQNTATTDSNKGKNASHEQWESSLSSQINPIILKIEEELKRLKTPEASSNSTADVVSIGLSGLGNLYKCVQQPLNCLHRDEKCINTELLEASSKLLDVGIATRDITILLKDATRSLHYALGEKRSELSIQSSRG
ncbi:hypothetical protein Ancab_026671 [Ancistrocladus abbreviatus]